MNVNYLLLCKGENNERYKLSDYIVFQLSSFAISLIINQNANRNNTIASIQAFRCILEGLSLLKMCGSGDINHVNEELLLYYSYDCEFKIYKKFPELDGILFNLDDIKERYEILKKNLEIYGLSKNKKNRLSWLNGFDNYRDIVEKYNNCVLQNYDLFGMIIHPNDYRITSEYYDFFDCDSYINLVVNTCEMFFMKDTFDKSYDYHYLEAICRDERNKQLSDNSKKIMEIINDISNSLESKFGPNLVASIYKSVAMVIVECYFDIIFGFKEITKCKFKPLFEMISLAHSAYSMDDVSFGKLFMHTIDKFKKILPNDVDYLEINYEKFLGGFTDLDDFKSFLNRNIGLESISSLTNLVNNCIDSTVEDKEYASKIKVLYEQSQYLSHANCYMLQSRFEIFNNGDDEFNYILDLLIRCFNIHLNTLIEENKSSEKNCNKIIYDFKKNINKLIQIKEENYNQIKCKENKNMVQ